MLFEFGLKSSILLIFFTHGIIFSVLLFIKGVTQKSKPSLWLSLFTLLCTFYISPFLLGYAGWYAHEPYRDILFYTPFQQLFLLPPILYFYYRTLLDKSFKFSRRHLMHFVPSIIYLGYSLYIWIADKLIFQNDYFYQDGRDKDFDSWYQVAGFISLLYYLLKCLSTYQKYKRITYDVISFADEVMFKWAQRFLLAFLALLSIRLLFFVLNPEWAQFGKKFWYYVCFSILFYYVSISGYINSIRSFTAFDQPGMGETKDERPMMPQMVNEVLQADNRIPTDMAGVIRKGHDNGGSVTEANPGSLNEPDYKPTDPDLEHWKQLIEQVMETNKAYENPALTLADFCKQLGIHPKKASQMINQGFDMNFNDFVNHYRTRAVIAKLEQGEHNLQTLLGIGFECGFNSKSTFNRAFKRYTNLSPKEYLQKNGLK